MDAYTLNNTNVNKHYKLKNSDSEVIKKVDNILLYDDDSANYLLWNYKGFNYINENSNKSIKLLNNDLYNIKIVARIDNLLLMANYNQQYNFNKFIIINMENGKKDYWAIDYEISMDSYILGINNKSVFLVDKKNKVEYEIVPYRKKMRIVGNENKKGIIYRDGFEDISMSKLINDELQFSSSEVFNYSIVDNKLYLSLYQHGDKILISEEPELKIVEQIDDTVYYLSKDQLCVYSPYNGKKLLMEYSEWNFNSENMVFVYK